MTTEITATQSTEIALADEDVLIEVERDLEVYFTQELYTAYGVRNVVNKILADMGIEKELPGPMFYTYCKKGFIKTTNSEKTRVAKEDAIEWTEKYLTKHFA